MHKQTYITTYTHMHMHALTPKYTKHYNLNHGLTSTLEHRHNQPDRRQFLWALPLKSCPPVKSIAGGVGPAMLPKCLEAGRSSAAGLQHTSRVHLLHIAAAKRPGNWGPLTIYSQEGNMHTMLWAHTWALRQLGIMDSVMACLHCSILLDSSGITL